MTGPGILGLPPTEKKVKRKNQCLQEPVSARHRGGQNSSGKIESTYFTFDQRYCKNEVFTCGSRRETVYNSLWDPRPECLGGVSTP